MLDEKYIISLIDSAKKYVHKLQYLADNNKSTLKAINTLKMLHQIYQWANFRGEKEEFKQELRELMHCIITGNSNLVLPEIIPGPEYSNVNTPQTIYTWQDVYGNVKPYEPVTTGTIRINKIVTVDGEAITDNTTFTVNITNGATVLTRTVSRNSPLILLELPFGTYTITEVPLEGYDLVSITPSIVTLSELNLSAIVNITNELFVEKFGTLMINKIVTVDNLPIDDDTTFTVGIDNGETTLYRTFSQNSALLLDELPLGTYSITEISLIGYDLTSIVPSSVTFTESNLEIIVDITNELYVEKFGNITINKVVRKDSIVIDDNAAFGLEIIGPLGTSYEMFSQNSPLVLTNVKLGEYTINEIYDISYTIDSISPQTFTLTNSHLNQTVIVTNSVCGEEIDCNCIVSFDYYEENSISVLSVGNLVGDNCEVDAYVIDWYRDGVHAMVSGKGTDPDIETFHPFIGFEAVPVLAGTWVPVVRYIVVSDDLIFSSQGGAAETCGNWCLSLSNLPVIIVVSPLNCDSVSTPLPTPYNYKLSYISSQDYNLASRLLTFELPSNLSAKYFAFRFDGFDVADKIQIYFNEDLTPLTDWTVGTRYTVENTFVQPGTLITSFGKFVLEIPTYEAGDRLIIKITPSVLEDNPRTNWSLSLSCLDDSYVFDCDVMEGYNQIIDNVQMIASPETCKYIFKASVPNGPPQYSSSTGPLYNLYLYGGLTSKSYVYTGYNGTTKEMSCEFRYSTKAVSNTEVVAGALNPIDSFGSIKIKKTGNIFQFICSDSADYDVFVSNYNYITNRATYSRPYVMFLSSWRTREGGCGDGAISDTFYFSKNATFTFSGTTITITLVEETLLPNLPDPCNNTNSSINAYLASVNNTFNRSDFEITTGCRPIGPLGYAMTFTEASTTTSNIYMRPWQKYTLPGNLTTPCSTLAEFYESSQLYEYMIFGLQVSILGGTTPEGTYAKDPTINFEVYSAITDAGEYSTTNQRLLYRIEDGVVTTNILPHY